MNTKNPVILSGASRSQSERDAQSKDPASAGNPTWPREAFSKQHQPVTTSSRRCNLQAIFALAILLLLSTLSSAQSLTGTVKNSTTNKPSAGDDVILLSLGQGMEEAGRTKSDAKGNFSLKLDNTQGPHLVRVVHEGVTYHRMAPPGTTSVEIEVYDAAKKLDGIAVVADIMRLQVEQGQLEVMRAFAVENTSKPPRTQMNERNLEFNVPEGAQVIEGSAMTAGGQPVNSAPVPVDDKKTRYAFVFPLRPGTTQFQVAYQLPYTGSANIDPKSIYPLQHFVAIMPKSIQFAAAPGTNYQPMSDPQQPDANVQVASSPASRQTLAFKITGEGTLQARNQNAGQPGEGGSAQNENRPGGGLGPPIDAPPPMQKYQWWIMGGIVAALAIGGIIIASRQQAATRAGRPIGKPRAIELVDEDENFEVETDSGRDSRPRLSTGRSPAVSAATSSSEDMHAPSGPARGTSSMLLEGLKEELFQLEIEHKQGEITQQEYEKAKAALDQTLQRALKREAAKQT
ncbi:MAG TPA: hypothetical protein VMH04_21990 [Candidatus Solibacter sp.]|nr:hypothetical protein [Candidatus Solibacter sp.]